MRVAWLASGSGTTIMKMYPECFNGGMLDGIVEPELIVLSKECDARENAISVGFPSNRIVVCSPKGKTSEEYGVELNSLFRENGIEVYGQHGHLPLTPVHYIDEDITGINQHPANEFFGGPGMHSLAPHAATYKYYRIVQERDYWHQKPYLTEAITHFVTEGFDEGRVIMRVPVPIHTGDIPTDIQCRLSKVEWLCQIFAYQRLASEGVNEVYLHPMNSQIKYVAERFDHEIFEEARNWGIDYAKSH